MQTGRSTLDVRPPTANVTNEVLAGLPKLRKYAVSLCGGTERADDLVQETMLRALANITSFEPGSNMSAWLTTILRNFFYAEYRKRRHEVEDSDGYHASRMRSQPEQEGHMSFLDLQNALDRLKPDHREALILVGGSGLSYADVAKRCGCAEGTIKSRVNRARGLLAALLGVNEYSHPN
jgi:RNA polymerase sigma-70 factor (ECF subfamily)